VWVWRWHAQDWRAVEDARGQKDLFGRELKITRKAVADNLVSAAQIVMGEGDEGIPAAIVRDSSVPIREVSGKIPTIPPSECMYIGALGFGPRPYTGGYDDLIDQARRGMDCATLHTPDSKWGQHFYLRPAGLFSRKYGECRIRSRHLCGEGGYGKGHRLRRA